MSELLYYIDLITTVPNKFALGIWGKNPFFKRG